MVQSQSGKQVPMEEVMPAWDKHNILGCNGIFYCRRRAPNLSASFDRILAKHSRLQRDQNKDEDGQSHILCENVINYADLRKSVTTDILFSAH